MIKVGDLEMRVAEAGEGPLVLLLHGFPECWYSWRHQLQALAEAGFHAVAPNQRGYPGTGGPDAVDEYTMLHLVGDAVGLIAACGERSATVIGHDWGAPVAWHTALLRPDLVRGIAALSVPHIRRGPTPTVAALRERFGEDYYQVYFQRPGVEAEFEADLTRTFRLLLTGLAGENDLTLPPGGGGFLDLWRDPETLPDWVSDADVKAFADEFAGSGFTGPLNWYRNLDRNWALTAAWHDAPITPPALMLAGELDPTVSRFDPVRLERSMRAYIPNLQGLEMVPGAGHWLQQERPDLVNARLVDFVTSTSQ
ncbi:alpha/beta hydrolase [Pseudonocardia eucalypti]|uniref:Alpha/beta hydrolase n=1 Tax=Pseudonocardia eucalypti TaxID=648755 RepID=A0ABP9Q8A3_9PSEU